MNTAAYERPSIVRHQMGAMNKFGRLEGDAAAHPHRRRRPSPTLVAEHGSPLFVFSERTLVAPLPRAPRGLHPPLGQGAHRVVVQDQLPRGHLPRLPPRGRVGRGGLALRVRQGARTPASPADRIHCNGPYKPDAAHREGARGRHRSSTSTTSTSSRASSASPSASGSRPKVAIRVNMAIEGQPAWSRFGFNLESGQAQRGGERGSCAATGSSSPACTATSAPSSSTPTRTARPPRKLARLRQRDPRGARHPPLVHRHRRRLRLAQHAQGAVPPRRAGRALVRPLRRRHLRRRSARSTTPRSELPTLVLETGRALVDDAGLPGHHRGGQQAPPRRAARPRPRRRA